jgi:multidrug efflux pump subunit AcrA (membrane-fusion protein)
MEREKEMKMTRLSGAARAAISILLLAGAASLALTILRGIQSRVHAESALERSTEENAISTVHVINPKRGAVATELILPGNMEAFTDTPVYARTNGYLRKWYVDIGAHVKAGQLLAEIETPEVDRQLQQARAELATAQANLKLATTTAQRWQSLRKSDSVSQQETDEKIGDLDAKTAAAEAAAANVRRLEDTQAFQKIYATFDGVITARNIDIGDLINAGSNGTEREMFHMAASARCASTCRCRRSTPAVPAQARRLNWKFRRCRGAGSRGAWCGRRMRWIRPRARCGSRWTWTTPAAL